MCERCKMCACMDAHRTCVEIREHLCEAGGLLPPPHEFLGLISGSMWQSHNLQSPER